VREFPGITEPSPSVTWSLDALHDDPRGHLRDRLIDILQGALTDHTGPEESLWILDRQHTCHRLWPHTRDDDLFLPRVLEGRSRPGRPLSPHPDENHHILLAHDLRFGTFGHPREHSLRVFGTELLDDIEHGVQHLLHRTLRRDGIPA